VSAGTTPAAIEIDGLTKMFGNQRALDGIDLRVPVGSVFGFLGPNGAGKSTTLNILTGLSWPTAGSARVLGHDVVSASTAMRQRIGYLPDVPGFYGWMTGEQFLRFAGELFGIGEPVLGERVAALLDLAGLRGVTTRIGGYSRGMKQRLGLAQALINAPQLLLLDEPTSALDPLGRKAVLEMLASLAGRTTIFFSTHILADVERVCDTIAILDKGRVVLESSMSEVRSRQGARWLEVELDSPAAATMLGTALRDVPWLRGCEQRGALLRLAVLDEAHAQRALPALIAAHDLSLLRLDAGEASLEEVFVDLVGGARA
jgi:ABC-2 type transport system ATP-binding protein